MNYRRIFISLIGISGFLSGATLFDIQDHIHNSLKENTAPDYDYIKYAIDVRRAVGNQEDLAALGQLLLQAREQVQAEICLLNERSDAVKALGSAAKSAGDISGFMVASYTLLSATAGEYETASLGDYLVTGMLSAGLLSSGGKLAHRVLSNLETSWRNRAYYARQNKKVIDSLMLYLRVHEFQA